MKTVRIHKYGGPEVLRLEEVPEPSFTRKEVLVKVLAAGINPVDWKIRQGALFPYLKKTFPTVLGWDFSGTILKTGSEVTNLKPGDKVFGLLNIHQEGVYAQEVPVASESLCLIPEGLDPHLAGAIPMAALTGIQLTQAVKPAAGKRILVTGAAGGVGRFAVYEALLYGALVTAGVRDRQKEFARSLFPAAVEIAALDDKASLSALKPFDAMADTIGMKEAGRLMSWVNRHGIVASALDVPEMPPGTHIQTLRIIVKFDGPQLLRAAKAVLSGEMKLEVQHNVPLAEAPRAHQLAEAGGLTGKIVLVP
jgi:NADPH2:quinone reductase